MKLTEKNTDRKIMEILKNHDDLHFSHRTQRYYFSHDKTMRVSKAAVVRLRQRGMLTEVQGLTITIKGVEGS